MSAVLIADTLMPRTAAVADGMLLRQPATPKLVRRWGVTYSG